MATLQELFQIGADEIKEPRPWFLVVRFTGGNFRTRFEAFVISLVTTVDKSRFKNRDFDVGS